MKDYQPSEWMGVSEIKAFRMHKDHIKEIENLIKKGKVKNLSTFMRDAVAFYLNQKVGSRLANNKTNRG